MSQKSITIGFPKAIHTKVFEERLTYLIKGGHAKSDIGLNMQFAASAEVKEAVLQQFKAVKSKVALKLRRK